MSNTLYKLSCEFFWCWGTRQTKRIIEYLNLWVEFQNIPCKLITDIILRYYIIQLCSGLLIVDCLYFINLYVCSHQYCQPNPKHQIFAIEEEFVYHWYFMEQALEYQLWTKEKCIKLEIVVLILFKFFLYGGRHHLDQWPLGHIDLINEWLIISHRYILHTDILVV